MTRQLEAGAKAEFGADEILRFSLTRHTLFKGPCLTPTLSYSHNRMSVWIPRRPPALISYRATSIIYTRNLHALALQLPQARPVSRPYPKAVVVAKRWQSTKDTASVDSKVPVEAKPSPISTPKEDAAKPPVLKRAWAKVKHEAAHYWSGTKLLVSEVRISSRLQWKILQGETLTRRERRQVSPRLLTTPSKYIY